MEIDLARHPKTSRSGAVAIPALMAATKRATDISADQC